MEKPVIIQSYGTQHLPTCECDRCYQKGMQLASDLKWFVEWGKQTCPHSLGEGTLCYKHACDICWRELEKLIGGQK